MGARFVVFLTILSSFLLGSGYYVGFRIMSEFSPTYSYMVWVAVYGIIILQIAGPFFYRVVPDVENRYFIARWVMFSCMGVGASLILYTLMADTTAFALSMIFPAAGPELSKAGIGIALALVAVTNIVGMAQVSHGPRVYRVSVPLPESMKALAGFKIAQVSDLHVGPTIGKSYAETVVEMVNELAPDMIALTGDMIDGNVNALRVNVEPLSALRSRFGVYSVLGNHELYWRAHEWCEEYVRLGFCHLNNEYREISFNGAKIVVSGVPDISADQMSRVYKFDPEKAIAGAPADAFKILLAHQPKSAPRAAAAGFDLQLSGHTHGGQFFPFTILVRLAERYVRGLHRCGRMWLYVNRGTGYWGPPIRFLVPSEVTLITLV